MPFLPFAPLCAAAVDAALFFYVTIISPLRFRRHAMHTHAPDDGCRWLRHAADAAATPISATLFDELPPLMPLMLPPR